MNNSRHDHPRYRSGRSATWQITRGILAIAALAAVIGGVPWALLRFTEWPITGIPTWQQISDFPAIAAEDTTIAAIFVVGIWIAWAIFVLCVVIEVTGEIRGTAATRLPAAGPVQNLARTLVASVAMTFGSLGTLAPAGAAGPPAFPATVTAPATAPTTVDGGHAVQGVVSHEDLQPGADDRDAPVGWQMVRVEDGDSAWDLAERHYGDGTAWHRLWEDNKAQIQADGRTWANQTAPIEPGWVLRVRSDEPNDPTTRGNPTGPARVNTGEALEARGQSPAPAGQPVPGPTEVTVGPGDSLWRLAEARVEDSLGHPATPSEIGPYWLGVVEANQDRLVDPGDPDLIFSGQRVRLPAIDEATPDTETSSARPPSPSPPPTQPQAAPPRTPRPPDTPAPPASPPTGAAGAGSTTDQGQLVPSTTARENSPRESPVGSPDSDDDHDDGPFRWHVIGAYSAVGIALSIGVTRAIRIRRRRRSHLHPRAVPRPSSNLDLHRDLIVAADEDAFEQLRAALNHLAAGVAAVDARCRPRVVQNDTDHIDVFLDTPTAVAPADWHVQADGAIWTCDPNRLITIGTDHEPAATPLLVTLGQPEHGGQLYIDLEAEGLIGLVGDPAVAGDVARAMVTELAHSPLAEAAQVIVVGDIGTPALGRLDRVTVVEGWDDAADNLLEWADQSHRALAHNGWANTFVARGLCADHDALIPLVVVTDHLPNNPDDLDQLRALDPRAAALIVVGDAPEGATIIDCAPGRLTLPELGLVCTPQTLDDDHVEAIADLLDDAETPGAEQLELLPALPAAAPALDTPATGNGGSYKDPPYEVLVRVLGDIVIEGSMAHLTPKQTSVVAYIAVHRKVTADRAADALWPTPTKLRRRRLSNTVSDCRTAIGGRHLPIAEDGRYRAGPLLLTDLQLFERRAAAATSQPPDLAIETLRGAIDLVSGPIFTYPGDKRNSPDWAWIALEDWHSIWDQKISALASRLTDLCVAAGDTRQAVEVAEKTKRIIPTDTELTERLMRAHAANGNLAAVRRVYEDHVEALAHLDLDEPAESTTALYEELLRANRREPEGPPDGQMP